jgi:uncharacterized membrane protein (UPF0182 family)
MLANRLFKNLPRFWWIGLLIGGILLFDVGTTLIAESLWFQEVHYLGVLLTRFYSRSLLAVIPFTLSLVVLWSNLNTARRNAWSKPLMEGDRLALPGHMNLAGLLPITLLISLVIGLILLHHGQLAVSHWQPNMSVYGGATPVPLRFRPEVIWRMVQTWRTQIWQPILIVGLMVALLIFPRISLRSIAILISLSFGLILSEHWAKVLLGLQQVPFNQTDPLFGRDIGFYIFTLPIWELFEFWFLGFSILTFFAVGLFYLLSGDSLSQGYFRGFTTPQQRHLYGLGGFLMLAVAFSYWLDRYSLLYSQEGVAYGATFTNVTVELPAYTLLSGLSLLLAGFLFWRTFAWSRRTTHSVKPPTPSPTRWTAASRSRWKYEEAAIETSAVRVKSLPPVLWLCLGLYVLLAIVAGFVLPYAVQRLVVQPNELQLEQPYIRHTIALTREAFGLERIRVETFDPQNSLTLEDLEANAQTVENIRIWDSRPLLETNRQLQRIRLYYEFPDADIDRYTLPTNAGQTTQQQVLIAARELDYSAVPTAAQTWVNQHLIYTHGYGFTMTPVNTVGEGGLPEYLVGGIEPVIVDPRVEGTIPIGRPRIYYGELTNNYVMTETRIEELDYPSGSDNVYNVYDGRGGVSIGNFLQRLLFAKHMRDWRMLLTEDFTPQTKLLFRRNINNRVRAIAPFLRYDSDPYLVVVNTGDKSWERGYSPDTEPDLDESYLYWIIDAYTLSDRFPYSDPSQNDFNYIRNSVKVVIDAYHGSVNFYVADAEDPIIRSWQQVFPSMFQSLDQMPEALRRHIRYAQDIYRVQSNELMTYHMTDPIVFYNREDQWRAPTEIYGNQEQLVEPYYLIMNLPTTDDQEEFILLRPFTPVQRINMIAWLSARSDGDQYGTMLLYVFPKQTLFYGPEQIEARINQDPVISQQISLWNRRGSNAIQGNLLVIPIEQSLIYVEPLYLEAEQNRLPILARVIVAYESRIVMAETLEEALEAVFQPPETESPIIREVEEGTIPELEGQLEGQPTPNAPLAP